jgi:hypothetical protein
MRVKLNCWITSLTGIFLCLCPLAPAASPTWTISGTVQTAAGTAVEGVTVTGDNGAIATLTAPDGTYAITVPNSWSGTITAGKTGWLITPASKSYPSVKSSITAENYTAYRPIISGTVTKSDGTPLQGAAITANNAAGSTTTNPTGYYELPFPYNWSGTLSATLPGYHFTDKTYTNITTDQPNQDFAGYQPTISGYVKKADVSGLDYGSHSCQLTVSDPNASNSPQTVTVTLDVVRPEIGVSPASVGFECNVDDPNTFTQALTISNNGYDTLNWRIAEDYDWLSIEPAAGQCTTEPNEVTLTVNPAGLEIGTYTCSLTITDENASNSPVTVPVSLHIYRAGERHVPTEYPTIRQAIDAAAAGDHVIIHPGRYGSSQYSAIYYRGKAITVRSIDPTDPNIVAVTILENAAICFDKGEGRGSVLDGLTINGSINCFISSPVIKNCIVAKTSSYIPPIFGIDVYQGNPHIQNCIFTGMMGRQGEAGTSIRVVNNRAIPGDTIIENCLFSIKYHDAYRVDAIEILQGHATIVNTTIAHCLVNVNNASYPFWPTGAGLFIRESDVSIQNSIIWGNRGGYDFQIAVHNSSPIFGDPLNSRVDISYSNVEGGREKILIFPDSDAYFTYQQTGILPDPNLVDPATLLWGQGNIDTDPLFAREPNDGGDGWFAIYDQEIGWDYSPLYNNDCGDFHLKSQTGRFVWDGFARADFNQDKQVDLADFTALAGIWHLLTTNGWAYYPYDLNEDYKIGLEDLSLFCDDYLQPRVFGAWVSDEVTSPCIDAGDPNDPAWQNELWPHGERINMGAYGGTPQASLSPNPAGNPPDLNHDAAVDQTDWPLLVDDPEMNIVE